MSHVPAERCLSIIQLLAEGAEEMPLGEIAERLELPKSGAHRLLTTLVEQGWAKQDPQTGFYRLSLRLAILGQRFYVATGVPDICQPLLEGLAQASREFVRMAVFDTESLVWVGQAQGASGGLMYVPDDSVATVPLHATASGKIWLSALPEAEARAMIERQNLIGRSRLGPSAVATMGDAMTEIAAARDRGYGLAVNEAEPGVTAMAAVIRSGEDGPAVGTVSIAGPSVRMAQSRLDDLAPILLAAARELSLLWPIRLRVDRAGRAPRAEAAAGSPRLPIA